MNDSEASPGSDEGVEPPIRDLEEANKAVGGNEELAQQLFTAFLEGLESHLQAIRQRHQAGDWNELRVSAHQLRGGAAYCGIPAVKAAISDLEGATKAGDPVEIDRTMEVLEQEVERLRAFTENGG